MEIKRHIWYMACWLRHWLGCLCPTSVWLGSHPGFGSWLLLINEIASNADTGEGSDGSNGWTFCHPHGRHGLSFSLLGHLRSGLADGSTLSSPLTYLCAFQRNKKLRKNFFLLLLSKDCRIYLSFRTESVNMPPSPSLSITCALCWFSIHLSNTTGTLRPQPQPVGLYCRWLS